MDGGAAQLADADLNAGELRHHLRPDTNATASEFMTTRSERPRSRAGPETTGPVATAMTGT